MTKPTLPVAEPVEGAEPAQAGWVDEFGNVFPMGAWKPAKSTYHDAHKKVWQPVYRHPAPASAQAGAVPVGWQLVPIEPTDAMEAAGEDDYENTGTTFPDWKSAYRAMLLAAPRAGENN